MPYPTRKGARPLLLMCINKIAVNISSLEEWHLDSTTIKTEFLLGIYARLQTTSGGILTSRMSLHAWKILSALVLKHVEECVSEGQDPGLCRMPLGLYHFQQTIGSPRYSLEHYTKPLVSEGLRFLTSLTINPVDAFKTDQLLRLADLSNLAYLAITDGEDVLGPTLNLNDRLVRGWSEKEGSFPSLQVLRLHNGHFLTVDSIQYVSKFRNLRIYDLHGTVHKGSVRKAEVVALAENYGWKCALISGLGTRHYETSERAKFIVYAAALSDRWKSVKNQVTHQDYKWAPDALQPVQRINIQERSGRSDPSTEFDEFWSPLGKANYKVGLPFKESPCQARIAATTQEPDAITRLVLDDMDSTYESTRLEWALPATLGFGDHLGWDGDWSRQRYQDPSKDTPLGTPGFWTCAMIEMMGKGYGRVTVPFPRPPDTEASLVPENARLPLPSKPFATLILGTKIKGSPYHRYIFHRAGPLPQNPEEEKPGPKRRVEGDVKGGVKPKKRQKVADVLGSFKAQTC